MIAENQHLHIAVNTDVSGGGGASGDNACGGGGEIELRKGSLI